VSSKADDTTFQDILDEPDEVEAGTTTSDTATTDTVAVDVSETTEPAAPSDATVPETHSPAAVSPALPDGYKLDAQGRVHGPDGRVIKKEDAERIIAEAKAAVPAPPPPAVVEAPKAPEVPATPPAEPFTFRADGQRIPIEGAMLAPDGTLTIPASQVANVRGMFAAAVAHRRSGDVAKQYEAKVKAAEAVGEARGQKYNRASVVLWDAVSQLLAEHPDRLEMLRREVALTLREADMAIPKPQAAAPSEPQDLEPAARATLDGYVSELLEDLPEAKLLAPEDQKDLRAAIQHRLNAYFELRDGQPMLSEVAVENDVKRELRMYQRSHQARESAAREAEAAKKAAAFNAAQVPKPTPKPPASARPQPAAIGAPSGARKKGWDQAFKDVWSDKDDDEE
jgi:hypothetical protein